MQAFAGIGTYVAGFGRILEVWVKGFKAFDLTFGFLVKSCLFHMANPSHQKGNNRKRKRIEVRGFRGEGLKLSPP